MSTNKTQIKFCDDCDKEVNAMFKKEQKNYCVKEQTITKQVDKWYCPICGEDLTDDENENDNLRLVYEEYKKNNNLLSSDEIKQIREKYGLSQKALALLLGWGEKTITRYERGAIQTNANNNILKLIKNTESFIKYWNANKQKLSSDEIKKCETKLKELTVNKEFEGKLVESISYSMTIKIPCKTEILISNSLMDYTSKLFEKPTCKNNIANKYAFY